MREPRLIAEPNRGRFLWDNEWRETLCFCNSTTEGTYQIAPFRDENWKSAFNSWAADSLEGKWKFIDTYRVVFEKEGDAMLAYLAHL